MTTGAGSKAVLVMAKRPVAGSTKTRLVPRLSPSGAADLYESFLLDALDVARSIGGARRHVAVWPPDANRYFERVAPDFEQIPQHGSTLGERLAHVMTTATGRGFDRVVAINSDSPTLPVRLVIEGFERLEDDGVDAVLGPAEDGGYYLIGWKRPHPELVVDVEMSTPQVLRDTLDRADRAGLEVALLPSWYDVDEPEDLDRLLDDLAGDGGYAVHTGRYIRSRMRTGR